MKLLHLLPIGNVDDGLMKDLRPAVEETFRVPCKVLRSGSIPSSPSTASASSITRLNSCTGCRLFLPATPGECSE